MQLPLFDLTEFEQSRKETDAWVKAVNDAARQVDAIQREIVSEWGVHPSAAGTEQHPELAAAMDKFVQTASDGKLTLRDLPLITRNQSVPAISKPLKRGTKVCAVTEITFADDTRIEPGRIGRIVTSGQLACNVHFEGYPENHHILCSWDMLAEVVKS